MRLTQFVTWIKERLNLVTDIESMVGMFISLEEDLSRISEGLLIVNIVYPNERRIVLEVNINTLNITMKLYGFSNLLTLQLTQYHISEEVVLINVKQEDLLAFLDIVTNSLETYNNESFSRLLLSYFTIKCD